MLRNARIMWLASSSTGDTLTWPKHHRNGENKILQELGSQNQE